jgi:hypothetical protein
MIKLPLNSASGLPQPVPVAAASAPGTNKVWNIGVLEIGSNECLGNSGFENHARLATRYRDRGQYHRIGLSS